MTALTLWAEDIEYKLKLQYRSKISFLLQCMSTSITEITKYFKSLYDFEEPYFKVHNLVYVHPKSVILGQMNNLNMVFHMVVSVYRLVKILKPRASSLMNFSERLMLLWVVRHFVAIKWFRNTLKSISFQK